MSTNSLAVTFTLKNEERLLPLILPIYARLGFKSIYVFLDETTDSSADIVKSDPLVHAQDSIDPATLSDMPPWVTNIADRWHENMDVRKRINTYAAALLAKQEGIEWLLCIDPDEIFLPGMDVELSKNTVCSFLEKIPKSIDQVLLRNYEVVATKSQVLNPFEECTYFFNRFLYTYQLWRYSKYFFRKLVKNPKLRGWYDYYFYRIRFRGLYPKMMYNPLDGHPIPRGAYLGYANHKSIIRTSSVARLSPNFDVHKWRGNANLKSLYLGALLHYDIFDEECLASKFGQRPVANSYNGDFHRNEIARIARSGNNEAISSLFSDSIMIKENELDLLIKKNIILYVPNVSRLFKDE